MDVSIVVTAYNYAQYIQECVASCLDQEASGLEVEVIVVDDGSTDQTPAILERMAHPRLRTFRIDNSGIEAASNYGFAQARGAWVVRVDADDKLAPAYLRQMAAQLAAPAGFYYPDYAVIDENGQVTETVALPEFDIEEIRGRGDFLATGTLYNAALLRQAGGYATSIRNSGLENYAFILDLLAAGVAGRHVPCALFYYRRHSLNISVTKRDHIIRNGEALFARHGLGAYRTNAWHPYKLTLPPAALA